MFLQLCNFVAHPVLVVSSVWWPTFPGRTASSCTLLCLSVWKWAAFHLCFSTTSSLLINVLNDSRNNSTPLVHLWSFLGYCCMVSCPRLHLALWAAQGSTHLFWALLVLLLSLDASLSPDFYAPGCAVLHLAGMCIFFLSLSIKLPGIGQSPLLGHRSLTDLCRSSWRDAQVYRRTTYPFCPLLLQYYDLPKSSSLQPMDILRSLWISSFPWRVMFLVWHHFLWFACSLSLWPT